MHRKSVAARMRRIAFGCVAAWTLAGAAPAGDVYGDVNGDGRPDRILESRFRQ